MVVRIAETVSGNSFKVISILSYEEVESSFALAEILTCFDEVIDVIESILVEERIKVFLNLFGKIFAYLCVNAVKLCENFIELLCICKVVDSALVEEILKAVDFSGKCSYAFCCREGKGKSTVLNKVDEFLDVLNLCSPLFRCALKKIAVCKLHKGICKASDIKCTYEKFIIINFHTPYVLVEIVIKA